MPTGGHIRRLCTAQGHEALVQVAGASPGPVSSSACRERAVSKPSGPGSQQDSASPEG